jgi:hypothetical protein
MEEAAPGARFRAHGRCGGPRGVYRDLPGADAWTVSFDSALSNYVKNMVKPWDDMHVEEEDAVADDYTVVARHNTATHIGEFVGIPASDGGPKSSAFASRLSVRYSRPSASAPRIEMPQHYPES